MNGSLAKIMVVAITVLLLGAGAFAYSKWGEKANVVVVGKEEGNGENVKGEDRPVVTVDENKEVLEEKPMEVDVGTDISMRRVLSNGYHIFQTWNNCAPAALSMALSHFGVRVSQEVLASEIRPNNNLQGKNDNKSTPPEELAAKAREYGLITYLRADGDIDILQRLVSAGVPVVMRTLLNNREDYAHYRVIKGYDKDKGVIIQDDSYDGKELEFSYDKLLSLWRPFNYVYLVIVDEEKKEAVEAILGSELDEKVSWRNARDRSLAELAKNSADQVSRMNLSVAYYYLGEYKNSTLEFEKVEPYLTTHTIWYQIEPIRAYFELGNYDRVFALSQAISDDGNTMDTHLLLLRGQSYEKLGNLSAAKIAYEKAVRSNINSLEARASLTRVGGDPDSLSGGGGTQSSQPIMGP